MMEVIDRRRIKTKDMAPMTVVNPSFQMELFHDTSTIPPYPYNPNKNKNNNDDNNNSDNTTPKTIDDDITTPKQIITHADIHNNNNNNDSIDNINNIDNMDNIDNNENIEMTGNNNARNRNSETSSLPPNWRYRNDTDNISFNNTNNLQYNTNNIRRKKNNNNIEVNGNDNNQENQASNLTSMVWDWSQESWESAYYKNINHDDNNGENNTNNLTKIGRDWSQESWESAYYKNSNHDDNNGENNTSNLASVGRDWSQESWESAYYKNNNTNMVANDENINSNENREHDIKSIDSVPESPPPPAPWQLVWISRPTSTHSLAYHGNEPIYECIEENHYLSATNLKTNAEFPKRTSTPNDSTLQELIKKHSPSCPMFPHKPTCIKYRNRSLPLVSRIPKMEFVATCPHDSVIATPLLFLNLHHLIITSHDNYHLN